MRKLDTNTVIFLIISDLAITLLAFFTAIRVRYWLYFGVQLTWEEVAQPWTIYVLVALIWSVTFVLAQVYDTRRTVRVLDEAQVITWAVAVACLVFAGVLYLTFREVPRRLFLYFVLGDLVLLIGFRVALRAALRYTGRRDPLPRRVLIVGAGRLGRRVAEGVRAQGLWGLVLVGCVDSEVSCLSPDNPVGPLLGAIQNAPSLVKQHAVDEVIFALPMRDHRALESLVIALEDHPVRVRIVPDFLDLAMSSRHY